MSLHCDNLSGELQDQWSSSVNMLCQRSFWLCVPLLKRDIAGHGEATINNEATVLLLLLLLLLTLNTLVIQRQPTGLGTTNPDKINK